MDWWQVLDLLYGGGVDVIISFITLFLSLILSIGTLILALETRRMREAQTQPDVYVQIAPEYDDITHISLFIGNIGQAAAYNIKFTVNPDFEYQKDEFLSELSYINKGLSYLSPNQTIKSHLIWTSAVDRLPFEKLAKPFKPFNISVKYKDKNAKKYKRIYPIDLGPLKNIRSISGPSIPKNVERIEKTLREISKKLN